MTHWRSHSILLTRLTGWFVGAFLASAFAVSGVLGQEASAGQPAPSSDDPVAIEVIGGDSLTVDPGTVVTVVYRIAPLGVTAGVFKPSFDIQQDWSIVFGSQDIELSEKPVTRFVTYKVPENERAGQYTPTLTLHDDNGNEVGRAASKVIVNSIHDLKIEPGIAPSYIAAGRSFDIPLMIANDGNAQVDVSLEKPTHKIASVGLSEESLTLEPGEHTSIIATVTTDADADRSQRVILRFGAHIEGQPEIEASSSISFDIVPVFAKMRPKAANTPLSLSVETIGDESGASPQASIHASGKLLGGEVQVAAVLAQTPRKRLYGQEPQVTVQYVRDNVSVTVGDHSSSTSPMTLTGERGVGLAAEYQKDQWNVKTSLQRSRTIIPVQERAVISAAYQASEKTSYSANLLHRNEFYSGTLFTARAVTQPFGETSKLDIECGVSNSRALQDPSCMLQTLGSTTRFSYQFRAQRASIDFPGTIAGNRMISAFTSFRLTNSVRLELMTTTMRRQIGNGADRANLYSKVGVNYSARVSGGNLYATIHGIRSQARYTLLEGTTERIENVLRVTAGYHKRRIGLTITGEKGLASADALLEQSSLSRYRFNGRYSILANLHLNGSMELSQGNLSSTSVDQVNRQYGLGATLSLKSNFQATITGFRSTIQSHIDQQYASLRAGVSKSFKSGRVLSIRAQFNENTGRQTLRTADYRISFTTPLDMPFGARSASDNMISGRVVDAESGAPIEDALLFLGNDLAITDSKGRFRFVKSDLEVAFLRVDAASIGYDRTPAIPMPMEIGSDFVGGKDLVIPISKASVIRGTISVFANSETGENLVGDQGGNLRRLRGHHGAVVQVSNELIRQRTRTDREGGFIFPQLPPGDYTVKVVRSNLSEGQQLERAAHEVTLEVGGDISVEFNVVPARKRIRMIKSTNLSLTPVGSVSTETEKKAPENRPPSSKENNQDEEPAATTSVDTDAPAAKANHGVSNSHAPAGWLGTLKQTARAEAAREADDRDASIVPFYLEQGIPEPAPTHPAYPLLFVLCILFLLVDLDLLVRSLIEERPGRISLLKTPVWISTARYLTLYGFAIVYATLAAGLLAGIAVSLALSGFSVAIESRHTYHAILNISLLHFVAGDRIGDWVAYRETAVQITSLTLDGTGIRHLNGIEETVPTHSLHRHVALVRRTTHVEATESTIAFSRLSNLRHIRAIAEARLASLRPEGLNTHADVHFEDIDAEWTRMTVRVVADASNPDISMVTEMLEAELLAAHISLQHAPSKTHQLIHLSTGLTESDDAADTDHNGGTNSSTGSHLRIIKGGNHKAA